MCIAQSKTGWKSKKHETEEVRYTVLDTRVAQGSGGEDAGRANLAAREERGGLTSEDGGGSGESEGVTLTSTSMRAFVPGTTLALANIA